MKEKKFLGRIFIIFLTSSLLFNCTMFEPVREFPYELMLKGSDLPTKFYHMDSTFPEVEDSVSYYVSFQIGDQEIAHFIAHQLTIHPDEDTARTYYEKTILDEFHTDSQKPSESEYEPLAPGDLYQLKCVDRLVNGIQNMMCELLQIHGNAVMYVLGHVNEKTMSFGYFEDVIVVLDERLPDEPIPLPKKGD